MHRFVNDWYPLIALALIICAVVGVLRAVNEKSEVEAVVPLWVGYGCANTYGPVWVMHLSDLPVCKEFVRWEP